MRTTAGPPPRPERRGAALPAPTADIAVRATVSQEEAAAVLALASAAARADGVEPLSEATRLHLRYGGSPAARNLLLWREGSLAGFAHLSPPEPEPGRSGELAVHPAHRGQGFGRMLAGAIAAEAAPVTVRVWAHGDLPAARGLAAAAGFRRVRELWQMRRSLSEALPAPRLPDGVRLRTFVPGKDEADWVAVNARAFASHPEQGRWTSEDLARREREAWFDPAGFFIAEREGRLAGFHWTKVHDGGGAGEAPGRLGEVYVVGVDPSEQGSGLGRALTVAGLQYLRDRGLCEVMLYVEGGNDAARRLYASLGFAHTGTDVMYANETPGLPGPGT